MHQFVWPFGRLVHFSGGAKATATQNELIVFCCRCRCCCVFVVVYKSSADKTRAHFNSKLSLLLFATISCRSHTHFLTCSSCGRRLSCLPRRASFWHSQFGASNTCLISALYRFVRSFVRSLARFHRDRKPAANTSAFWEQNLNKEPIHNGQLIILLVNLSFYRSARRPTSAEPAKVRPNWTSGSRPAGQQTVAERLSAP